MFLRKHNESRFLYHLQQELLDHHNNMQRALNGTAASYVPNTGQRDKLEQEKLQIDSMLHGLTQLATIWRVSPKPGKEIPAQTRVTLTNEAYETSATIIRADRRADGSFAHYMEADIRGLENLFHYLGVKICISENLGQDCTKYASLNKDIGYTKNPEHGNKTSDNDMGKD